MHFFLLSPVWAWLCILPKHKSVSVSFWKQLTNYKVGWEVVGIPWESPLQAIVSRVCLCSKVSFLLCPNNDTYISWQLPGIWIFSLFCLGMKTSPCKPVTLSHAFTKSNDFYFKLKNLSFWPNSFFLKGIREPSSMAGTLPPKFLSMENLTELYPFMKESFVKNILAISSKCFTNIF